MSAVERHGRERMATLARKMKDMAIKSEGNVERRVDVTALYDHGRRYFLAWCSTDRDGCAQAIRLLPRSGSSTQPRSPVGDELRTALQGSMLLILHVNWPTLG